MNVGLVAADLDGVDVMMATLAEAGFGGDVWDGASVTSGGVVASTDIPSPYGINMKGMTIANGEWGRKMAWNGAWTRLRIGALVRLNSTAGVISNAVLFFGICNGTSKMYGASDCIKAYGMMMGYTQTSRGAFTRKEGVARYEATYKAGASKIAGVATELIKNGASQAIVAASGYWSGIFADMDRSGTNVNMQIGTTNPAYMNRKFVVKNLMAEAFRANAASQQQADNGVASLDSDPSGVAASGGSEMDTLNLYWSGTDTLEIGALMAARQY